MVCLVRAAALTNFAEVARSAGLDPLRLLAEAGLGANVLQEPDLRIPADRACGLIEAAAAASGLENFGLRMAQTRQLSNLGPVGLLIRDQPSLRKSLEILVRYHALLNGSLAVSIEETAGLVLIREDVVIGTAQPVRQAVELAIGVIVRLMGQFLGPGWTPRRVCFTHPAPRDVSVHLRVFGACVEFCDDFNGVVVAKAELDAPNPTADPAMARYAQQLIDLSLAAHPLSMVEEVRRTALLLLPSGRCTIEQVCAHLGLVCRTVQRRLADEGVSFSGLVNDLRVELAARHVTESARPLTEVAAMLGFSAPSGFSRWYATQFGCSPTQARSQAAATRSPLRRRKAA